MTRLGDFDTQPDQAGILDAAHTVAQHWFGKEYDLEAFDITAAAAAAERLDGDPPWLLLVSGSGNAKTETVMSLVGAGALMASRIKGEASLLSGTPRKERAASATGGLLRRIGARGVLVIKDFTSILAMSRDARDDVLSALREIHDGHWGRDVGAEGGRWLEWHGRIVIVGAVTTAWDRAHSVVANYGDRFVLVRMDSTTGRMAAGRKAIGNVGNEDQMRKELAEAMSAIIANVDPTQAIDLDEHETERLLAAADLVTLARTAVDYDYQGRVVDAQAPEMPTRFAKELAQIMRGAVAIGIDRQCALQMAIRCARDSMPPLRLTCMEYLARTPGSTAADVRKAISKPRTTIARELEALDMLDLCDSTEAEHIGGKATWSYVLSSKVDMKVLDRNQKWQNPPFNPSIDHKTTCSAFSGYGG